MLIASLRTTGAVALVFLLLSATFILLAAGNSGDNTDVIKWGGYIGLATAVAAWYASFAAVVNSTFKRTILPVFPLDAASDRDHWDGTAGPARLRAAPAPPLAERYESVVQRFIEARRERWQRT